jgi:hypothetical protein
MRQRSSSKAFRPASAVLILSLVLTSAAWAGQDNDLKKSLLSGWKMWRDLVADLNAMTFTVGAGYYGDASSQSELDKLDISAAVAKSGYPNDIKFDFASSIQLKRSGVTTNYLENMTSLLLSYEHNLLSFFKAYGFVERFTDTYLSIQQRYETGIGVKGEFEIGLTGTGRKKIKDVLEFEKTAAEGRDQKVEGGEDIASALAVDENQIRNAVIGLKKKYALLSVGLACTTLAEIERASINLPNGSATLIDPRRRFRVALRPSLTLRPSEGLSIKWQTYFKMPAFGPTRLLAFDGTMRYDLRTDTFVTLKYDLPKSPAWARRLSLLIDYKYFFDNVPPFVPGILSAAAQHNSLAFKIQAEF